MAIAINNVSGIVETSGSYTADVTGDNNLLLAFSIEGDADEGQSINAHTHAGTSFTNANFAETAVGTNAIYSHVGWIPDASITTGSQTYVSTLSGSPPSIGHSSLLMSLQGAHQTSPIITAESQSFAGSGASSFPTHTVSMTAGQLLVYIVQLNKATTITAPANLGSDAFTEQLEPWFIGGSFIDGAVYTLIATETHSSATFVAGEGTASFIYSSHHWVIDQAAAGGGLSMPVAMANYRRLR